MSKFNNRDRDGSGASMVIFSKKDESQMFSRCCDGPGASLQDVCHEDLLLGVRRKLFSKTV